MKTTVIHEFAASHLNEFGPTGRLQFAKKDENLDVLEDITITLGDDTEIGVTIAKWLRYQLSDYDNHDIEGHARSLAIVSALMGHTRGSELPNVVKYWDKTVQIVEEEVEDATA